MGSIGVRFGVRCRRDALQDALPRILTCRRQSSIALEHVMFYDVSCFSVPKIPKVWLIHHFKADSCLVKD